jgi:hypothetical protein
MRSVPPSRPRFCTQQCYDAFCNQGAGSVLVPSEALRDLGTYRSRSGDNAWDGLAIRELADKFAVSREVIVLRLRHLNRVTDPFVTPRLQQYVEEYRPRGEAAAQRQPHPKRRGLPPYKASLRENGMQYIRLGLDALERDRITLADASAYLGLRVNLSTRIAEKKKPHHVADDEACTEKVGAPGFEPGTSCSQSRRDTGLRYAPNDSQLSRFFPRRATRQ